ncbi:flagellar protein FlaG [Brockia lithotrophica]|uniref:flagellar protein FlaG n=1 Tax=Brockia lithotrophica TaxID=933949 RepID=UPI000EB03E83|nr:flagellar protein FlaG [Brockia lithotrophica]
MGVFDVVDVQGATSLARTPPLPLSFARVPEGRRAQAVALTRPGQKILGAEDDGKSKPGEDGRILRRVHLWGQSEGHTFETRRTHLRFVWHEELREYYVRVVDDATNEVIREIPPKKWLDLVAHMLEHLGLLVDARV